VPESRWREFRLLWLRQRADRPGEFLGTFADAQILHESAWRSRLAHTRDVTSITLGVERDGELIATVGAYIADEHERVAYLRNIVVHTESADLDVEVGQRLFREIAAWASRCQADTIIGGVEDGKAGLQAYLDAGFTPTGVRRPVGGPHDGEEIELAYRVRPKRLNVAHRGRPTRHHPLTPA
jgi:acetyltransferase (GNAT) family protein